MRCCTSLLVVAVSTFQCSAHADILAAVAQANLPKQTKPPAHLTDVPKGANAKKTVMEEWILASKGHDFPHQSSSGWRLVPQGPVEGNEWCVRRLKFWKSGTSGPEEVRSGCKFIAPGADLLKPEYAPKNAFEDTAVDGCSLKDSTTGLYYIGLMCGATHKVEAVDILQMLPPSSTRYAKVQQLHAGNWIDVGKEVSVPVNYIGRMFEAASCHTGVCTADWVLKTPKNLPNICANHKCSLAECCDKKDTCSKSTCTTSGWGLKTPQAAGTRCSTSKCSEGFCCEKKGFCLPQVCDATDKILKPDAPEYCTGPTCTIQECCKQAVCTAKVCLAGGLGATLKNPAPKCAKAECTIQECCNTPTGGKGTCQQSDCAASTVVFADVAFGETCLQAKCTEQECCKAAPTKLWSDSIQLETSTHITSGLAVGSLAVIMSFVVLVRVQLSASRLRDNENGELLHIMEPSA